MIKTEFEIDDCKIMVEPPCVVRFSGVLMRHSQLERFEADLQKISELLKNAASGEVVIDIVKCDECISLLLKPFLLWVKHIVLTSASLKLIVAQEEEEILPWHETVIDRVEHFNINGIPLEIKAEDID
jgi:hypothetical protein